MSKNQLIDKISSILFNSKGYIVSRKSYLKIRNYLVQLDVDQLKIMLKEFN